MSLVDFLITSLNFHNFDFLSAYPPKQIVIKDISVEN